MLITFLLTYIPFFISAFKSASLKSF